MNKKLKLYAVCTLAVAALALSTVGARGQKTAAAGGARALTPQERRGRAIYLRGESPSGREIKALLAVAQELEVPFVGPSTLLPRPDANRYVFYLLPGMAEQARAPVNFHAKRRAGAPAKVAVVYEQTQFAAAAAAVEEQCQKSGCGPVQKFPYEVGNRGAAAALVPSLKGADAVFLFGAAVEPPFIREAEAAGWRPDLYLLGTLTG